MRVSAKPLIDEQAIRARTGELAQDISRDHGRRDLLAVVVLKGAAFFAADLLRQVTSPVRIVYVRARSYQGNASTGRIALGDLPDLPLEGAHLLVVEDILDTGRTASRLLGHLYEHRPASLRVCTLLDKPARRLVPVAADYVGFVIDDHFVVGYGLDYEEHYRNLPAIHILEEETARPT